MERNQLFEVLSDYRVHEKQVGMVEILYSDNVLMFEFGNVVTDWCKSDSGVGRDAPYPHFC